MYGIINLTKLLSSATVHNHGLPGYCLTVNRDFEGNREEKAGSEFIFAMFPD